MKKRQLLTAAAFLLVILSAPGAWAKPYRIVLIETMPVPVVLEHSKAFVRGLGSFGHIEGESVSIEKIEAAGDRERAEQQLRAALERGRPDAVVTFATLATQAAEKLLRGTDIPLVFSVVADPVGSGIIQKEGEPTGNNVTGVVYSLFRDAKLDFAQDMLAQKVPSRPVRLGVVHSSYPSSTGALKKLVALARPGLEFVPCEVEYRTMPSGLDAMLADARKCVAKLSGSVDFWWILPGPLGEVESFDAVLMESGTPVGYCNTMACVRSGGLFAVTPNYEKSGLQQARIVDTILKGTDPGAIPPLPPEHFDVGVNLNTAVGQGIVVPSNILQLAEENIWR